MKVTQPLNKVRKIRFAVHGSEKAELIQFARGEFGLLKSRKLKIPVKLFSA